MQRAEGSSPARAVPEPTPSRPGLSPIVAFLLLIAIIGAIGTLVFFLRPNAPPPTEPRSANEPNFALTDQQAIDRFEQLSEIRRQAYASADSTLLGALYTSDSVVGSLAEKELRQLKSDGVSDVSTYETKKLSVVDNEPTQIELREIVVVTPRFEDSTGSDVTTNPTIVREVVSWTLMLQEDTWLIHDAVVVSSDPIE
jgi:hypothetical protein